MRNMQQAARPRKARCVELVRRQHLEQVLRGKPKKDKTYVRGIKCANPKKSVNSLTKRLVPGKHTGNLWGHTQKGQNIHQLHALPLHCTALTSYQYQHGRHSSPPGGTSQHTVVELRLVYCHPTNDTSDLDTRHVMQIHTTSNYSRLAKEIAPKHLPQEFSFSFFNTEDNSYTRQNVSNSLMHWVVIVNEYKQGSNELTQEPILQLKHSIPRHKC